MKQGLRDKKIIIITGITLAYCIGLVIYAWLSSMYTPADLKGFDYAFPVIAGGIFLVLGSLFVLWLLYVKKAEVHNLYLGMAVVVFSLFLWAQPPVHGHDIQFHYDSTYVLSDIISGMRPEGLKTGKNRLSSYYRREGDRFMQYSTFDQYIQGYADMQEKMFDEIKAENAELIEVKTYQGEVSVPLYFYFPQAMGFTVARLLGLNVYWLMYLGCLFICAACTAITYFSIRQAPFGKEIFLVYGLIPTTMMSYASVSRDALILAVSAFFISKCLQLAYREEKKAWWHYGILFVSLVLLAPYKLVYIPFAFLLGLLVYRNCKQGKWKKKYLALFALLLVIIAGVFVAINFNYLRSYLTGANSYSMGEDAPFTLPYVFNHIGQTIKVVINTLLTSTVRYYANMIAIGDYGGGIRKEMVVVETLFIAALVLASNKSVGKAERKIDGWERLIMVLTWICICGMIFLAYLLCTPYTNDVILGIQGRYFTPALPLMILSFYGIGRLKKIKNKYWLRITDFFDQTEVKRGILLGIYGLSVFVVVNMYVYVVTYVAPV